MSARVTIAGMPRFLRKLKVLPAEARKEIREAMGQQADAIVAMMRQLAPEVSGDLRKSIGWTWGNKVPNRAMAIATSGKGDLAITIFAGGQTAFHARWVEFGTADHIAGGLFEGAEHPGTPAQPFFFPSWRAMRKSMKAALRKASRDAAKRVAAK